MSEPIKTTDSFIKECVDAGLNVESIINSLATVYSHALIANVSGVHAPEERIKYAARAVEGFFQAITNEES